MFWKSQKNSENDLKMAILDNGKAKEKVILPMTVLKRFDDIPAPTKEAVVKKAEELQAQGMSPVLDKVMALLYYDSVS